VIEREPPARLLVVQVAEPEASATPAQPVIVVPPSLKSTVPVAAPALPATLAVNVTAWPNAEGFAEDAIDTDGLAFSDPTVKV